MPGSKNTVASGAGLALFFFAFLQSELLFDNAMAAMTDQSGVVLAQAAVLAASALGFASYSALARRGLARSTHHLHAMTAVAPLLGAALVATSLLAQSLATGIAFGCAAFFALGLWCADAHLAVARKAEARHLGKVAGLAYAAGPLLQFAISPLSAWASMAVVALACAAAAGLKASVASTPADPAAKTPDKGVTAKSAKPLALILLIGILTCIFSTLDNVITMAHASGSINVVASPRVILAASGAAAGVLFDLIGRRGATLATFCSALLATIVLVIAQTGGSMGLALVIFYVSAGVFATFFTTEFLHVAVASEHPGHWAGAGRAENNLVAAALAPASLALMATGDIVLVTTVTMGLLCLAAATCALHIRALGEKPAPSVGPAAEPSLEERVGEAAASHGLTPRETDVLLAVVSDERTLSAIADDLGISLRMVQRHLTSVYKKTGTSSRAGLVRLISR